MISMSSGSCSVEKCQVAEAKSSPGVSFSTTTDDMVAGSISGPAMTTWFLRPVYSSGSQTNSVVWGPMVTVAASRAPSVPSRSR